MATVVKIDIDKPYHYARGLFERIIKAYNMVRRRYGLPGILRYETWPSDGFRFHAVVYLERSVDCWERYLIARLLGDDPLRSLLNLSRCVAERDADVLFFHQGETDPRRW